MNSKKYPIQNYIPTNPKLYNKNDKFDLDARLKQMTFNEIINDPEYHFKNSYVTNFDLIHNECRGDELHFSRKYYETIAYKRFNEEITNKTNQEKFISSTIKSERKDIFIEKKIYMMNILIEKKLKKNYPPKNVFLSSMKKKTFFKKN